MLKQVLQQNASKAEAKSNQSQRQTLASRLSVFGMQVETNIISSSSVPVTIDQSQRRTARLAMMSEAKG